VTSLRSFPPLSAAGINRAAVRRTDPAWLAHAWASAKVVLFDPSAGHTVVVGEPPQIYYCPPDRVPDGPRYFLGEAAGQAYFAVVAALPAIDGGRPATLRDIGTQLSEFEAGLLVEAVGLANWHASHRFSPRTGEATAVTDAGWSRSTADGAQMWPRTDPAVIVLVHDGSSGDEGRCLLGHNAAWTGPRWAQRYSCLAGFVEPGESAEAAVVREVAEETGVPVGQVHYVASQPWPFPASLMLGFHAIGDPTSTIRVDPNEISDARWFSRAEVRAMLAAGGADITLPMQLSIAYFLIERWLLEG
jgi:NAD+ diphosphatase